MRVKWSVWMLAAVPLGPLAAQDSATATGKILSSLALIVNRSAAGAGTGTGFCFWSTPSKSYFLTNRHVVEGNGEILVRIQNSNALHNAPLLRGRLFPTAPPGPPVQHSPLDLNVRSAGVDLAVVVVDTGSVPVVTFSTAEPPPGQEVGIGGFPSFQFESANGLQDVNPSFHFGTANSLPDTGHGYIQFDALADHGNSGGPLFDRRTGAVYGVVTLGIQSKTSAAVQNNLAVSDQLSFLSYLWLPRATYLSNGSRTERIPCNGPHNDPLAVYNERDRSFFCGLPDAPGHP